MKGHIINEKEKYKSIGLHVFGYKLSEEGDGEVTREVLYGYPFLKHLIQL